MEQFELPWLTEQPLLAAGVGLLLLLILCGLVYLVTRRVIVAGIERLTRKSRTHWDDALTEAKVFHRLALIAPALVAHYGVQFVPHLHDSLVVLIERVAVSTFTLVVAVAIGSLLSALNEIYWSNPDNHHRPIKGYLQVLKIAVYLLAGISVLATLMDRSPLLLLSGIGAMTAVVLLIFKDTILSLVASIQITGNDMVRVGDWIEMPQYGADGDVIDVALHTVKVQNWDKTITTIPTHKLISDSFRNWRGMQESGGRRIKRSIFIDVASIRFLDEEEIRRFGKFRLLADYIRNKSDELARHNSREGLDPSLSADVRRLTNIGTLRAYVVAYLRDHPKIHDEMTLIVRQRDPTPEGLPLEIYAFTNDTAWASYESIQSDIFDHIMAIVPEFGLRVFQNPSGADLASWTREPASRRA